MKLSKIYSNHPELFSTIKFNDGLNVIVAEIKDPENKSRDTHNLGKSTLAELIDFCLLKGKSNRHFLFKALHCFEKFTFYLEVKSLDTKYITIRRSVSLHNSISFKFHNNSNEDFTQLPDEEWDYICLPFSKSRQLLDDFLDLQELEKFDFRDVLGYLLRSQKDYFNLFKLATKDLGSDELWKPRIAHLLGVNSKLVQNTYKIKNEISQIESSAKNIRKDIGCPEGESIAYATKIMLRIQECEEQIKAEKEAAENLQFLEQDKRNILDLVEDLTSQIRELNRKKFYLLDLLKRYEESLRDATIAFDPNKVKTLFEECRVLFPENLVTDFQTLIQFNKDITTERKAFLKREKRSTEKELSEIDEKLATLDQERSVKSKFIKRSTFLKQLKYITEQISVKSGELAQLKNTYSYAEKLTDLEEKLNLERQNLIAEGKKLGKHLNDLQKTSSNSILSNIQTTFSFFVKKVLNQRAIFSVTLNSNHSLEFEDNFTEGLEVLRKTQQSEGTSYRKILCVAFDVALLAAHLETKFPRFLYHDGIFEALDNRKKASLLGEIRSHCENGIQHIVTLIDSDLPSNCNHWSEFFDEEEVILRLHDDGEDGRLFKMPKW